MCGCTGVPAQHLLCLVWCWHLSWDFVQQHRPWSWLLPPQPRSQSHPPVPGPSLMSSSGAVGPRWEESSWATPGAAWSVLLRGVDPGRHVPQSHLFLEVSTHCGRVRCVFLRAGTEAKHHSFGCFRETRAWWSGSESSRVSPESWEQTHVCLCFAPC